MSRWYLHLQYSSRHIMERGTAIRIYVLPSSCSKCQCLDWHFAICKEIASATDHYKQKEYESNESASMVAFPKKLSPYILPLTSQLLDSILRRRGSNMSLTDSRA